MPFFNQISGAQASLASRSEHSPSTLANNISEPGTNSQQSTSGSNGNDNYSQHAPSINEWRASTEVSVKSHVGGPIQISAVKDITFWGGLALIICNTAGPGSFTLPTIAQSAGWIPTVIGFVLVGYLSYLSSMFTCEAMTLVPGNEQFQENVRNTHKSGLELVPSRVPAIGSDMSTVFGSIMFNYGYVAAVPSLANAKKPDVSIQKVIGTSTSLMTSIFIVIAVLGGMAYNIPKNSSLIQAIHSAPNATTLSTVAGFTYPIAALITSIPVNIIVLRYNLIQSGAFNKTWASLLSGVLPWLLAIPGMTGTVLTIAVSWSSLLFVSSAIFVIPFVLFIVAKKTKKTDTMESMEVEQETSGTSKRSGNVLKRIMFWKKFGSPKVDGSGDSNTQCCSSVEEKETNIDSSHTVKRERGDSDETEVTLTALEKNHEHKYFSSTSPIQRSYGGESSRSHHRTLSTNSYVGSIPPPFLSGNNYAIPGFGACQPRPELLRRSSSELALHRNEIDPVSSVSDNTLYLENGYLSNNDFKLIPTMKAIPRWFPVSSTTTAWTSLVIMVVGIVATVM
ncbi:hypothetical protein BGZ76_009261 [Entomortierella beljakovae]|nr:hypothetical protein BGZ76_009261 [Entomortierella beljakovae]